MENLIIPLEIFVVPTGDYDFNDVEKLNASLQEELYETVGESAEFSPTTLSGGGVKGLEGLDWSSLLVTLVSSTTALTSLFRTLHRWLDRNPTTLVLTAPNGTTLRLEGELDEIDLPELVSQFQSGVQREGGVDIVVEEGGRLFVDGDIVGRDQKNGFPAARE